MRGEKDSGAKALPAAFDARPLPPPPRTGYLRSLKRNGRTMPPNRQSRNAAPESGLAARLASELKAAQAQASALRRELTSREADLRAFEVRIGAVEAAAAARIDAVEAEAAARIGAVEAEAAARIGAVEAEAARQIGIVEAEAAARMAAAELEAAARAEQRVLAIYRSTSWRLTGPLRRSARLMHRLLGR